MLVTHDEEKVVVMALADRPPRLRAGQRVEVTTTSRPLPEGLRTLRPHVVEGELVGFIEDGRTLVIKVEGWSAWAIPTVDVVSINPVE